MTSEEKSKKMERAERKLKGDNGAMNRVIAHYMNYGRKSEFCE